MLPGRRSFASIDFLNDAHCEADHRARQSMQVRKLSLAAGTGAEQGAAQHLRLTISVFNTSKKQHGLVLDRPEQGCAHNVGCGHKWRKATPQQALAGGAEDTQIRGRIGSPSVAGSTRRFSSGTNPWSLMATGLRPPPVRRTLPFGGGTASRSSSPRLMVERASPVISETILRPPYPAACTSDAANIWRPRSSSLEPTASHRSRIACLSIIRLHTTVCSSTPPQGRGSRSLRPTHRDSTGLRCVLGRLSTH